MITQTIVSPLAWYKRYWDAFRCKSSRPIFPSIRGKTFFAASFVDIAFNPPWLISTSLSGKSKIGVKEPRPKKKIQIGFESNTQKTHFKRPSPLQYLSVSFSIFQTFERFSFTAMKNKRESEYPFQENLCSFYMIRLGKKKKICRVDLKNNFSRISRKLVVKAGARFN